MAEISANDAIVQAIDTIVSQRISSLEYDKTVICKITDNSDASNGHYVVNDGSISFDAYCENTQYQIDDNVYVTIPKGDFTQTKVIISKYTANNNEDPLTYKSPLDNMFIVSNNLASELHVYNNGIVANGRTEPKVGETTTPPGQWRRIWEYNLDNNPNSSLKNNAIFDSLGIKAKFKCDLGLQYNNVRKGRYGLIVEFYSTPITDSTAVGSQISRFTFDTTEMFGNPYLFLSYFEQSKVFDITKLGNITKINIYLFQDGNFYYTQESPTTGEIDEIKIPNIILSYSDFNQTVIETECPPNIFIEDLEVYFGMNLANIEDNTFMIYSASPTSYSNIKAENDVTYNQKEIIPIWYNKDETNNYLGFSDGIYEYLDFVDANGKDNGQMVGLDYDERVYVKKEQYLSRGAKLKQSILTDKNIPAIQELLQIYSYGEDVLALLQKIVPYVNTNLTKVINNTVSNLRQYQTVDQQNAMKDAREAFLGHEDLLTLINYLDTAASTNVNTAASWNNSILNILQYYGNVYLGADLTNVKSSQLNSLYEYYSNLNTYINNVKTQANVFFNIVDNNTEDELKAVYELWKNSCEKIFTTIEEFLAEIQLIIDATKSGSPMTNIQLDDTDNNQYGRDYIDCINWQICSIWNKFSNTSSGLADYESTRAGFIESYAKRYCIFWYRYKGGYKNENEYFMPANWELIENTMNVGLPGEKDYIIGEDRNLYWVSKPSNNTSITITVNDKTVTNERIQAILIYDHQVYKSNIIAYVNEDPIIDEDSVDATKGLYIATTNEEYSQTEFDADGGPKLIQEDTYNNQDVYQLYGMTGYLVNQKEKYVKRTVRARFAGIGNKGDNYLAKDCIIYWYLPIQATMLEVQHKDLIAAGFSVFDPTYMRGETEYYDNLVTIMSGTNLDQNQRNAKILELKEDYLKGKYSIPPAPYGNHFQSGYLMAWKEITSTNGIVDIESTEFFYQIKDYYIPSFTNNTIKCKVVKNSQYVYEAEHTFTFASYGTNGTDYSLCITPITNQAAMLDDKGLMLKIGVYDINGNLMDKETSEVEVGWHKNFGGAMISGTAPEICVSKISSTEAKYNILKASVDVKIENYIEAERQDNNLDDEASTDNKQRESRTVTLTAYYPIAWAADDYYIEGPTTIVYDSLGANPTYYNGSFKLFYGSSQGENAHKNVEDLLVSGDALIADMDYYCDGLNNKITTLVRESLPKIKIIEDETAPNGKRFDLSIPNMYLENDFYALVKIGIKRGTNNPVWIYRQPLMILQNRFSSPMLNSWDGELTIDEKNGTILATMVGAGKKESDNTFSGVLMGEVATSTEDVAIGISTQGIYGFHHGEQAFGFKNDGTGFIGKAKKGRIEFDGNSSRIQSMSYSQNELGMMLDLDDGLIDMRGAYIDYTQQSDKWKAVAEPISSTSGGVIWTIPESKEDALNNNEVNGYNNQTKYTSSGSRVTIQTKTPFFEIKSPSIAYIPGTVSWKNQIKEISDTTKKEVIKKFWKSITYFTGGTNSANTTAIEKFLNETYNLYDVTEWRCLHTGNNAVKITASATNNISGTLPTSNYPFYVRIDGDITENQVSTSLENRLKDYKNLVATEQYETTDINGNNASTINGSTNVVTNKGDLVVLKNGGYIKFNSGSNGGCEYITPEEATDLLISSMVTSKSGIVNDKNHAITSITESVTNNASSIGSRPNFSISSYAKLSDLIIELQTAINQEINSASNLNSSNIGNNIALRFLQFADYEIAYNLYINDGEKDSKTLIKIGTDEYYLQTDNFNSGSSSGTIPYQGGRGLKFDLMKGSLEAYNFKLLGADPTVGSYFEMNSSGNPFLRIVYNGSNKSEYQGGPIDLIKITNSEYFLQSQNWYEDTDEMNKCSGLKLDLQKGKLHAYGFTLKAGETNGSYIELSSSGNPYIKIHHHYTNKSNVVSEVDLLNIGKNVFKITSPDYINLPSGSNYRVKDGTYIDLLKGEFNFYHNFRLIGSKVEQASYIIMSAEGSSNWPFLRVVTTTNNDISSPEVTLINIEKNSFYLQSRNYSSSAYTGTHFNLSDGQLIGYNFRLRLGKSFGDVVGFISVDSTQGTYPLAIGVATNATNITNANVNGARFRVNWNGELYAANAEISGKITATEGKIGAWFIANNRLQNENGSVYLSADGGIYGASISGSTITGGTISGSTVTGATISGSTIRGATFEMGGTTLGFNTAVYLGVGGSTQSVYVCSGDWNTDTAECYSVSCEVFNDAGTHIGWTEGHSHTVRYDYPGLDYISVVTSLPGAKTMKYVGTAETAYGG